MAGRILFYSILFIVLAVLQTTFCHLIAIRGIEPDLIVLFVVAIAMKEGGFVGVWFGFLAGLFFDVFSPQVLGTGSLAKSLLGYFAGLLDERTIKIDDKYRIAVIFFAVLLHDLIVAIATTGVHSTFESLFLTRILPAALYTTFFGGLYVLIEARRQN